MDQLFRMSDALSAAVDALLGDLSGARRDARQRAANGGRYGDLLRGWQGQAELIRARLTKEVLATRLACGGQELKDLAKSEYFAELPPDPQQAIGEATLARQVTNNLSSPMGNFTPGVIPAGSKLHKVADILSHANLGSADYASLLPTICGPDDTTTINNGDGTWTHIQFVEFTVQAVVAGPASNFPFFGVGDAPGLAVAPTFPVVSSTLFDTSFVVEFFLASGGTLGVVDDQIRALARALAIGSNGPTGAAVVAGALTNTGVRRAVYVEDPVNAMGRLFIADESWASSATYQTQITKALLARPWIGWGCRVGIFLVQNLGIHVSPTILLRSGDYISFQDDITANIHAALLEYFDDRPDWYTWTLNAIGAVIGGADDRILACTAVAVFDDNDALIAAVDSMGGMTGPGEPSSVIAPGSSRLTHYALVGQGVTPSYSVPGA